MFASQPAAWQQCPCCWRTCQAAMGDACLGIVRLRAAASNSHSLQPFHSNGPFLCDDVVRNFVASRQKINIDLLTSPACAEFQAIGSLGRRSKVFDVMGLAAIVCRHEFVMVCVNLFTEENFAYYDLMLEHLLAQYPGKDGKQLHCFFLDIACQFKAYWNRCVFACCQPAHIALARNCWSHLVYPVTQWLCSAFTAAFVIALHCVHSKPCRNVATHCVTEELAPSAQCMRLVLSGSILTTVSAWL